MKQASAVLLLAAILATLTGTPVMRVASGSTSDASRMTLTQDAKWCHHEIIYGRHMWAVRAT